MFQYERGTRTQDPECKLTACDPPIYDPCSASELARCECDGPISSDVLPVTIQGFQLVASDKVGFVPIHQRCPDVPENFVDFINNAATSGAASSPSIGGTAASDGSTMSSTMSSSDGGSRAR